MIESNKLKEFLSLVTVRQARPVHLCRQRYIDPCVDNDAEALVVYVSPVFAVDVGFVVFRLDCCGGGCLKTGDRQSCVKMLALYEAIGGLDSWSRGFLVFVVLAE
jgi:hypothetical protein